jgi:hypothetical protein
MLLKHYGAFVPDDYHRNDLYKQPPPEVVKQEENDQKKRK